MVAKKIGKKEFQDGEKRKNRKLCIKKSEKNRKINSTFVNKDSLPAPLSAIPIQLFSPSTAVNIKRKKLFGLNFHSALT